MEKRHSGIGVEGSRLKLTGVVVHATNHDSRNFKTFTRQCDVLIKTIHSNFLATRPNSTAHQKYNTMASSSQTDSTQRTATAAHLNSYEEWNHAGTWEDDDGSHDAYEDYGDFGLGGYGGGGGGGGGQQKIVKRQAQRGGGGSGTIYSAKHVRTLEARRQSQPRQKVTQTQSNGK
jgi:hypothetical protein